jgi:hypothetical protein
VKNHSINPFICCLQSAVKHVTVKHLPSLSMCTSTGVTNIWIKQICVTNISSRQANCHNEVDGYVDVCLRKRDDATNTFLLVVVVNASGSVDGETWKMLDCLLSSYKNVIKLIIIYFVSHLPPLH